VASDWLPYKNIKSKSFHPILCNYAYMAVGEIHHEVSEFVQLGQRAVLMPSMTTCRRWNGVPPVAAGNLLEAKDWDLALTPILTRIDKFSMSPDLEAV
jgi:hypothetical protein